MNWEMYGVVIGALTFLYGLHRNAKKDLAKRFDKIDKQFEKVDQRFERNENRTEQLTCCFDSRLDNFDFKLDKLHDDVSDIKERVVFLEAASIYSMPVEPAQPNPRSQAAKERWARRRQMKIERKDA